METRVGGGAIEAEFGQAIEACRSLPSYSIVVVAPGTPVGIKGCRVETGTGDRSTRVGLTTATGRTRSPVHRWRRDRVRGTASPGA